MGTAKSVFSRIVSMVLAIAIMGNSCAFASERSSDDKYDNSKKSSVLTNGCAVFVYNGHGEFKLADGSKDEATGNLQSFNNLVLGDTVLAKSFNCDDIFYIDCGKYLIHAEDDIYILSDKLIIDYTDPKSSFKKYAGYDIPDEIKCAILSEIESQNGEFSPSYSIELYIPSKTFPGSIKGPKSDPAYGDTSVSNYTFNGYTLKTSVIKITGDQSFIDTHLDAFGIALNLVSFGLSLLGTTGTLVNLFGVGNSAYGLYSSLYGNVGSGSNDYLHVVMSYTRYKKMTSVYYCYSWEPGLYSQKVILGQLAGTERFGECLNYLQRTSNIYETMLSSNYNNPSAEAISNVVDLGVALYDTYPWYTATYTGKNGNEITRTFIFPY